MSERDPIDRVEGRAVPLRGDDIDTDRILPARYLKAVTFDGLGENVFRDDRAAAADRRRIHPFDDPAFAGASILLVNRNFGCGSSREHAPQALKLWGIRAIVGESFSEIFFGNSVALGVPCVTLARGVIEELQEAAIREPGRSLVVDVRERKLIRGPESHTFDLPEAVHSAFVTGHWDAAGMLLEALDQVRDEASRLPYLNRFSDA
jgi:3-isopropylmalate/(R)-2-methylmalate dehydratase small subunit